MKLSLLGSLRPVSFQAEWIGQAGTSNKAFFFLPNQQLDQLILLGSPTDSISTFEQQQRLVKERFPWLLLCLWVVSHVILQPKVLLFCWLLTFVFNQSRAHQSLGPENSPYAVLGTLDTHLEFSKINNISFLVTFHLSLLSLFLNITIEIISFVHSSQLIFSAKIKVYLEQHSGREQML